MNELRIISLCRILDPVDLIVSSSMGSQKANELWFAIPAGRAVPAGSRYHSAGGHVTRLAAYSAGEPGLVEVDPCRRREREPCLTFSPITMRPEIRSAALDLIKMLQLFLRHSHSGDCNFGKGFTVFIVMFPFIASYRL